MIKIISSKRWYYSVLRIGVLASIGWWGVQQSGWLAYAEKPTNEEWPNTDFTKHSVDLNEITSGGPPKDGIPAIDHPRFEPVTQAGEWLNLQEPVIVLESKGTARAYPLQILIWHEILNDKFMGVPVAVTFCPLCNASIVFDRRVQGKVLDFGVTGRLRESDMVMYDRQTESWWQQFSGIGIVGEYTGTELKQIHSKIVSFETFRLAFPQGDVLSRKTGYWRQYGVNPYRGYDTIGDQPFLLHNSADKRLPAMERVLSVSLGDKHRIYPFSEMKGIGIIQDTFADTPLVIFHQQNILSALDAPEIKNSRLIQSAIAYSRMVDGKQLEFELSGNRIVDKQTGSEWSLLGRAIKGPQTGKQLTGIDGGVHFAFAWLAFNPDSEIYRKQK